MKKQGRIQNKVITVCNRSGVHPCPWLPCMSQPVIIPHGWLGTEQHFSLLVWEFKGNLSVMVSLPCCDDCHVNKEREHLKNFNFNSVNWSSWMQTLHIIIVDTTYTFVPRDMFPEMTELDGKEKQGCQGRHQWVEFTVLGWLMSVTLHLTLTTQLFSGFPFCPGLPLYCPLTEVSPDPCSLSSPKWLPLQQSLLPGVNEVEFFLREP